MVGKENILLVLPAMMPAMIMDFLHYLHLHHVHNSSPHIFYSTHAPSPEFNVFSKALTFMYHYYYYYYYY